MSSTPAFMRWVPVDICSESSECCLDNVLQKLNCICFDKRATHSCEFISNKCSYCVRSLFLPSYLRDFATLKKADSHYYVVHWLSYILNKHGYSVASENLINYNDFNTVLIILPHCSILMAVLNSIALGNSLWSSFVQISQNQTDVDVL